MPNAFASLCANLRQIKVVDRDSVERFFVLFAAVRRGISPAGIFPFGLCQEADTDRFSSPGDARPLAITSYVVTRLQSKLCGVFIAELGGVEPRDLRPREVLSGVSQPHHLTEEPFRDGDPLNMEASCQRDPVLCFFGIATGFALRAAHHELAGRQLRPEAGVEDRSRRGAARFGFTWQGLFLARALITIRASSSFHHVPGMKQPPTISTDRHILTCHRASTLCALKLDLRMMGNLFDVPHRPPGYYPRRCRPDMKTGSPYGGSGTARPHRWSGPGSSTRPRGVGRA